MFILKDLQVVIFLDRKIRNQWVPQPYADRVISFLEQSLLLGHIYADFVL